jgi:hypothetical protein
MPDWMRHFLDTAKTDSTKSSSLAPLQWLVGICFAGTYGLAQVTGSVGIAAAGLVIVLGLCGFYCYAYRTQMQTNPDALRSERYSLSKLAIEKGLVGDNLTDLIDPKVIQAEPKKDDQSPPLISGPGVAPVTNGGKGKQP